MKQQRKQHGTVGRILLGLGILLAIATTATIPATAQTYTYDAAGRLSGVLYADGSTLAYRYDANGNLLERVATTPASGVDDQSYAASGSSLTAGPNPMSDATTIAVTTRETGRLILLITDLQGAVVATIPVGRGASMPGAGEWSIGWDGTDEMGAPVAAGLYTIRLLAENDRLVADTRVLLLR